MNPEDLINPLKDTATRHAAFTLLMKEEQERIYRLIRRMVLSHEDADDLTQSVFIKVYENLDSFESKARLSTWMYRIAVNETLSFLRHKRRKLFVSLTSLESQLEGKLEQDPLFNANEIERKLQKGLLHLPEKQRLVFQMRHFEEMKYEQISEILGTSVGALKASYHLAEKKIKDFLTHH